MMTTLPRGTARAPIVLAALVVLASCAGAAGTLPPPTGEDAEASLDATLGPGDVFDIAVYGEEELSATYRVSQSGSVRVPFLGMVEVEGLEPEAVAELLERRLAEEEFLLHPQVTVFVREYNSKRVSVVGAVASPGTFPMRANLTVVQAITLAGGFNSLASRNQTVVTRRVDGELQRFRVRVDDVTRGRADDMVLHSGDIVYVPERVF